jgi:hypothetical protein
VSKLTIVINDQPVYEYDKNSTLNGRQLEFLDSMDGDMARGLRVHGELIDKPDTRQRANFVAMNLIRALLQEDDAKIQVSCAYLASRLPDIDELHARDEGGKVSIDMIENKQ